MSEFRIDQIKSQDASRGPDIAGITTFTGTSGIVMPSGDTSRRLFTDDITTDQLVLFLDVDNFNSFDNENLEFGNYRFKDLSLFGNHANLNAFVSSQYTTKDDVKCFHMEGSTSGTKDISVPLFYQNYIANSGNVDHSWECWLYSVKGAGIDPFNSGACGSECIAYFEGGNHFDNTGGRIVSGGRIDGEWHQYGLIKRGTYVHAFRDGKLASDIYAPEFQFLGDSTVRYAIRNDWNNSYSNAARPLRIGSRGWANRANDWYFNKLRFYRKSLSAEEILRNFNANRGRFGL
jgi:hypothetical protein